jgi:uncharacterized protein YqeY
MLLAAIKQREVDDRRDMSDPEILQIVEKLIKQRREAAQQFAAGNRKDLEQKELDEAVILAAYLPAQLSEQEIGKLLDEAIASSGAAGIKDMGKVMNALKPQLQGRADMARVSALVRTRLSA